MLPDVPDTQDGGPADAAKWRFVRRRAFSVYQAHGYSEVRPSPVEPAGLAAQAGTVDAIVLGQGAELRADPQAAIAQLWLRRAGESFVRWFLAGTVFDRVAPGALRWRAWHAVAGLAIGAADPAADAETIILARSVAEDLGLRDWQVVVGTLGERADVEGYVGTLGELLPLRCATCAASGDALRFLSCEDEGCRALAANAPPLRDFLGVASLKHHESLLATLEAAGIHVDDDPRLAFGQGRFTRTLIELRARNIDDDWVVVARGGRRDDLVSALGGAPAPAVGLTLGVARAGACMGGDGESWEPACEVFFAARGAGARAWALRTAAVGRALGFRTDVELREVGWEEQVARAERVHARVVVLAGEKERRAGVVAVRDMRSKEFRRIPEDTLVTELKRILR
jgi:histidyl-tRNA synthetase